MNKINFLLHNINQSKYFYNNFKKIALIFWILLGTINSAIAQQVIDVDGSENGLRMTGKFLLWYDEGDTLNLDDAVLAYTRGEFQSLNSKDSTGLRPGAVWSHFYLHNTTDKAITLQLEYVDHQLITLQAFKKKPLSGEGYEQIVNLAMNSPFSERPIPHNRFVFDTTLAAGQTSEYFVKFASDDKGFVFPNLRLWSPKNLMQTHTQESLLVGFLFGGLFLMSVITFIVGIITRETFFFADSADSFFKIISWATIFGYTHQFVLTEHFHWSYMSISGAISLFCAYLFARIFLQTRKYTPNLDYLLLFMMGNAAFLLICALLKITSLAVMSITLAMLMFPLVLVIAIKRYLQGSKEAGVFAFGWSFLIVGFVLQALRDMGFVEHNMFNYYWPFIAVNTEMVVILVAMGLRLRLLRRQKIAAEQKYTTQLEHSKSELEIQVKQRTRELELQKSLAEKEASTDPLTSTHNRRSFFAEGGKLLEKSKLQKLTLSLLMFDIDHFKKINDTYGHQVGDEALRKFAETISNSIRAGDIFGRLGGEEFSLLMCASKEDALQMAERLRKDISKLNIETSNGIIHFTTSVGVAHLGSETMLEELLNQADLALYAAKHEGRNKVIESEPPGS
jgi:two-component system, sensor histidine kinase LadS